MRPWLVDHARLVRPWLIAAFVVIGGGAPATVIGAPHALNDTAPTAPEDKLDPTLKAIARAWRRFGVRGAVNESMSRNVPLEDLRLAAVIHVGSADGRPQVERAVRKAWGEVVTANETQIYVQLPVPAIRRVARLAAVHAIYVDRPAEAASEPSEERPR